MVDPLAEPELQIRRLYAYVAYRVGGGPDAEDIVSETIERALRYRASYDSSAGSPSAWLIGIANRCIADHRRSAARRSEAEEAAASVAQLGDVAADAASRADLHRAVARLDDRERELIGLRYGADLKAREIADLLGMKTNAVEVALHRVLERLRVILGGPPSGGTSSPPSRASGASRAIDADA